MNMRKRINQVDMIIFYINRDFVDDDIMFVNMREEENEGLTCF